MSTVVFDLREIDQNFQIESGITKRLASYAKATLPKRIIELAYDLLDDEGDVIEGSLVEKCEMIARELCVRFTFRNKDVIFIKNHPENPAWRIESN